MYVHDENNIILTQTGLHRKKMLEPYFYVQSL